MVDKAYCITLLRRPEKWSRFKDAWDKTGLGWDLEKFAAIDGSLMTDEFIKNSPYRIRGKKLDKSKGHHACALSHAEIHKNAINNGFQVIAIFEDDCWFKDLETLKTDIDTCIRELPHDWKVLMIGGKGYSSKKGIPQYESFSDNLVQARHIFETHAYIVNVKAASESLIYLWTKKGYDADAALVLEQAKGGYYLSNPILCSQKPGWSDIIHEDAKYHGIRNYTIKEKLPEIKTVSKSNTLF